MWFLTRVPHGSHLWVPHMGPTYGFHTCGPTCGHHTRDPAGHTPPFATLYMSNAKLFVYSVVLVFFSPNILFKTKSFLKYIFDDPTVENVNVYPF